MKASLIFLLLTFALSAQAEEGITLSPEQQAAVGIETRAITPAPAQYRYLVPGEVLVDQYRSYLASPRLPSVVLSRHTALGDHVVKGAVLVTLFSAELAEAQGDYLSARPEWQRVKGLGKAAVGEQRFVDTKSRFDASLAKLRGYGLDEGDIAVTPLGQYPLRSAIDGVVLSDSFQQGQAVAPGEALVQVADEASLWVQAQLPGTSTLDIPKGTKALVSTGDTAWPASVSQAGHTLDPVTRTRTVRLSLPNPQHALHAGMYVDVAFLFETPAPVMALPQEALIRSSDGDWTVFVEPEPGHFEAREVTLGKVLDDQQQVLDLEPGTKVAVKGAFYIASELAKAGFSAHNH
ncbi:efflux RND transporter periplasmic adaptor subunit [Gallaecimonas pentaromativorans]|uniref:RND family efflux transporter MFP subunit n=1 Tax=Gallaecimonas pentaromativorans TaxID=584787 RepID=A0A3N1PFN0_9GAMM|nr:efflux RND transporter periplasmic adaptor subunit [Gallaecimonas pentaromativorans]ROQ27465.1 RND family efflux transporter MFP subunit [Gallaecimonas pentaromativorans]